MLGEMPQIFNRYLRKARKQHLCCECRKPIKTGDTYWFARGLWDHRWGTYKVCVPCEKLRAQIHKECDFASDEAIAFEHLSEAAGEYEYPMPGQT